MGYLIGKTFFNLFEGLERPRQTLPAMLEKRFAMRNMNLCQLLFTGENMFRISSRRPYSDAYLGKMASEIWYDEINLYKYPGEGIGYAKCKDVDPFEIGHFSQV